MTSKDDDTLPLPGLSQEVSIDASVDEDFIPTTQPQSSETSKLSKDSESKSIKPTEELGTSSVTSGSSTKDTLSQEATVEQSAQDKDKSVDFIPDTETKKTSVGHAVEDIPCKKKLLAFDSEDTFNKDQANTLWDANMSKITESPSQDTPSFFISSDTPTKMSPSNQKDVAVKEKSITEIVVNDSLETVDLEQTPVKLKKSENETVEKLKVSCSNNSDVERCEETQILDYSSVLLSDQGGSEKSERFSGFTPEKCFLQETLDDNEQKVEVGSANVSSSVVSELPKKGTEEDVPKVNGNKSPKQEVQHNSTTAEQSNDHIVTRLINFRLAVSCRVTFNAKTNKVLQKTILNVDEIPKSKPRSSCFEQVLDNLSDKSKRHSTSSSGSVYSDKTGLPFALPKRVSAISDQTDSSEEDLGFFLKNERRALGRIPWTNEYLLPLKMDDLTQVSIENPELPKRPSTVSSPQKLKTRSGGRVNHLSEILESSSSERTSVSILGTGESEPVKTETSEVASEKEKTEDSTRCVPNEEKQSAESERSTQNETDANVESVQRLDKEQAVSEGCELERPDPGKEADQNKGQTSAEVVLREGLPVLARWTDKRYYSGVLSGSLKSDRWEVKFDDGASKMVRDDFIIPTEWLTVGALVFVLTGDEYQSGQVVDAKKGDETNYVVELDDEKKRVTVKISDLRMTDVMVNIIREKYKPVGCTPRAKADIDFDNVLSGKRLREQKTPLRPQVQLERGTSGGKKKSSSRAKKNGGAGVEKVNETLQGGTVRDIRGLKSENGHLVEDKVVSMESPSGNDETPLRGTSKKSRLMAKPRSLSYEAEVTPSGKKSSKSYLRADGTPIPGTSGVKFKKQKRNSRESNPKTLASEETVPGSGVKSPQTTEGSRRKRKLDESADISVRKTAPKDTNSKRKRKIRI